MTQRCTLATKKPVSDEPGPILNQLMEIARVSALAEMASGISHEINQPLGAIAAFSQAGERMLRRGEPLVEQAADVFRQISQEALSAGEGIRRIRRLFDHDTPARTACRMAELLEELRPILNVMFLGRNATLAIEVAADLPPVLIDRLRIQHVLLALVQNALDACAVKGGPQYVRITVSGDRYAIETSVTDSGDGVADGIQEQLFKPFFTTKIQGTGLGLASSRAIIETHDGTMGFDHPDGGGSRFWFRLPVIGA